MGERYKEKRECWLLKEFRNALCRKIQQTILVECGEEGSSDGRLIVSGEKMPVQIVTADGVRHIRAVRARESGQVVAYDANPIPWIKHALEIKVGKNYADVNELTLLVEHSGLGSINFEYLSRELADVKIQDLAKQFKEVYILSPSDSDTYGKRHPAQNEAILFKIPIVG